jgi:hypothetical protein
LIFPVKSLFRSLNISTMIISIDNGLFVFYTVVQLVFLPMH